MSVNEHLGCWKGFEKSKEEPGSSTEVQPPVTMP